MKRYILFALLCIILFPIWASAQTYTWNGSVNSSWANASNWTPTGIPGAGATVNITNASPPNHPSLAANTSVATIVVNSGRLYLSGYTLTATNTANFTNAIVDNGRIDAANFATLTGTTFSTSITLNKTAGGNNTWAGGNTFNNLTLINDDNNWIRMANTTADVFNGATRFTTTNQYIDVAYTRNATFNGNVTIDATGTYGIRFGQNGGASTITSGFSLLTTGYTANQLILRNVTQNGTTANGTFTPTNFTTTNSVFGGSFTCTATTANITTTQFSATNSFEAANFNIVRQSTFSSVSGNTTFTKTAGSTNNWYGGNTFYNTTILNNSTNQNINLTTTLADVFYGTSRFVASGANRVNVAYTKNATFNGNVYLDNTSTTGIYFGANGGSCTIASGYSILTNGFAIGTLSLLRVTQSGSIANGTFSPTTFVATNSTFGGNFSITGVTAASFSNSTFSRTNTFTSDNFSTLTNSSFSAISGTTTFTKTAGNTDTWVGGNTFTNCTVTNSSSALIRIGTTLANTFNGTTRFVATGNSYFQIAYTSNATFNGNLYLDCTSSNGIFFGTSTGTTTIATGYAMLTNGFSSGTLSLTRVTQNGPTGNATFNPTDFVANSSTIKGNFTIDASGTISLTNSIFQRTNVFSAPSISTVAGNNFSAISGTTTFNKSGAINNIWVGGNTFYNTTVNNTSASNYLRLANTNGDTFFGTNTLNVSNGATILAAYNGTSTAAGNIYMNCSGTGGVSLGAGAGALNFAPGYGLKTSGYSGAPLLLNSVTQTNTFANDSFNVTTLTINNSSFAGDLTFNASTVSAQNSTFSGNNKFYANNFSIVSNCVFSQGTKATTITKLGGTNDTWAGGNTFGNVTVHNRSDSRMRFANNTPDIYQGTIIIVQDSTGLIEVAYNGTNSFKGNISLIGSTSDVYLGAGNGTIQIDGTGAQNILGGGIVNLYIERLTMSTSGSLSLQTPVNITTSMNFASGRINTSAVNLLIIADNATVSNASNSSCVVGPVRKIGNDAFTFPTGNSQYYAPIAISAPSVVSDHFTAEYFRDNPNDAGYDTLSMEPTMELISTREYWMLNQTNGTSAVDVTMSWGDHSASVLNMTALRVAHWDAANSIWNDLGFKNYTGTEASGTVTTASAVSNFSPFSFGSSVGGGALPVEMTEFTAHVVELGVALDWTTAIEINNDYYLVERSADGNVFEVIGEVEGAGNSSIEKQYSFIDTAPLPGLAYYRLKQIDYDGVYEDSKLVSVFVEGEKEPAITWSTYPNPAQDKLQIAGGNEGEEADVEILDQNGHVVQHLSFIFGLSQDLDLTTLSPGAYALRIKTNNNTSSQKFIKL